MSGAAPTEAASASAEAAAPAAPIQPSQPMRAGRTMWVRPRAMPARMALAATSGSMRPGMAKRLPAVSAVRR